MYYTKVISFSVAYLPSLRWSKRINTDIHISYQLASTFVIISTNYLSFQWRERMELHVLPGDILSLYVVSFELLRMCPWHCYLLMDFQFQIYTWSLPMSWRFMNPLRIYPALYRSLSWSKKNDKTQQWKHVSVEVSKIYYRKLYCIHYWKHQISQKCSSFTTKNSLRNAIDHYEDLQSACLAALG